MARIVFMGTPEFAIPTLSVLIEQHVVVGVVTQPDRPAGRKNELKAPPVKELALAYGIPVIQPEKLREPQAKEQLKAWGADLFVVAAFGQLLPQSVLDMPKVACINVHGSLLPRWRGAAPIQASIRAGDAETGVTIMLMDAGLDTGDMLTKRAFPILPTDTAQTIHDTMSKVGAELLLETLPPFLRGEIMPQKQDESLVTIAPQIEKEEGRIQWANSAIQIERTMRAFTPWPGTFTMWDGKLLKVLSGTVLEGKANIGEVFKFAGKICVGTGDGLLVLGDIQLEGKKRTPIEDFVNGYPEFLEAMLG
jgi:methionyl-tRNA formyltransferase